VVALGALLGGVRLPGKDFGIALVDDTTFDFDSGRAGSTLFATGFTSPTAGNFVDFSVKSDSASFATNVGDQLVMDLLAGGDNGRLIMFDNVRLDAQSDTSPVRAEVVGRTADIRTSAPRRKAKVSVSGLGMQGV
jgi:hypothetical protein